jgi:hypothetical protein
MLDHVPRGLPPALHPLRQLSRTRAVGRGLRRYARAVRLPAPVHHERLPAGFPRRTWHDLTRPRAGPPGCRATCCRACQGSPTPPGPSPSRHHEVDRVACRVCGARRHLGGARLWGSIPCLHVPLSTLRASRYRQPRMTRGPCGWLTFTVRDLHPSTHRRLIRRTRTLAVSRGARSIFPVNR